MNQQFDKKKKKEEKEKRSDYAITRKGSFSTGTGTAGEEDEGAGTIPSHFTPSSPIAHDYITQLRTWGLTSNPWTSCKRYNR